MEIDLDEELAIKLIRTCQEFCENMSQQCSKFLYAYYKQKATIETKKQKKQQKIKLKNYQSNNNSNEEQNIEIALHPESVKDPEAPKKPQSAFIRFFSYVQQVYQLQNKQATATEICKIASQQWAQMSDENKKPYYDEYQNAVQLYKQQKNKYQDKKKQTISQNLQKEQKCDSDEVSSVNLSISEDN